MIGGINLTLFIRVLHSLDSFSNSEYPSLAQLVPMFFIGISGFLILPRKPGGSVADMSFPENQILLFRMPAHYHIA